MDFSIKALLKPVLRFALARGVRIQELIELLKASVVEIAAQSLADAQREVSVNRISLMTGLHRNEVARFHRNGEVRDYSRMNIVTRLINCWQQDSRFTTSRGKPRVLPFDGPESLFSRMVRSVSKDLNPYSVLFELERAGAARRTPRGVMLIMQVYVTKDLQEGLQLLADDTQDLFRAVEGNLMQSEQSLNLHIKSEFDAIPRRFIPEIREWMLREGSLFHQKVREYLANFDQECNEKVKPDESTARVALGSFSITEERVPSKAAGAEQRRVTGEE